jgi:hypothetical protein
MGRRKAGETAMKKRIIIALILVLILFPVIVHAFDSPNTGEWTDSLFVQDKWTTFGGPGHSQIGTGLDHIFTFIRLRHSPYWDTNTPAALKYITKVGATNIYPIPPSNSSAITDVRLENSSGYLISYATIVYSIDFSNNAYVAIFFHDFDNEALILAGTEDLTFDWTEASEPDPNLHLSANYWADADVVTPNPPDWEERGMTLTRYDPTCTGCSITVEWTTAAQILYFRIPGTPYDEFDIARVVGETQITVEHQNVTSSSWIIDLDGSGTGNLVGILSPNGTPQRLSVESPLSGHGRTWTWGPGAVSACNFTAAVQNIEDGNVVTGATIKIWDITLDTWQSFVLPYGIGSVSLPYLGDVYAFNATKTGYTGYDADPPGGFVIDECPNRVIYAYLSGPPSVVGNATVHFFVTNPDALAIDGAQVCLKENGMCQATNMAGTASFPLLIIGSGYNYTVTKENYYGVGGNFTGTAEPQIINVILTQGVQPTATTTPAPTIMQECPFGDTTCVIEQTTAYLVSIMQFVVQISGWILIMTLIWMFVYVSSGRIPGYKGGMNRGGSRGGFGGLGFGRKKR